MTSEETLETVLPALLRRDPRALAEGTVVQLIVPDDKARYFYPFTRDDVVVQRGLADKVDLTLSMVSEDLQRFLEATLDFDHAIRTKRVKVMGDASLLLGLATALGGKRADSRGRA